MPSVFYQNKNAAIPSQCRYGVPQKKISRLAKAEEMATLF
jgi:hypothetical protein